MKIIWENKIFLLKCFIKDQFKLANKKKNLDSLSIREVSILIKKG
jgi:hypothetical protein